jgi:enoyl-CoA hydratase/carnithine racemase
MPLVRTELNGAIARVTLDHAPGNRINFDMRAELAGAFERVAASDARVLIVCGEGPDLQF